MKVVRADKIIDLDKFESVRYRESILGADYGFPVEAIRHEAGFFGTTTISEEIARVNLELGAKMLLTWMSGLPQKRRAEYV